MTTPPSLALPSLSLALLPRGGLAFLKINTFEIDESADKIFESCSIATTEQLMSVVLMVHTFGDKSLVPYLLTKGVQNGILTKQNLHTLYFVQNEEDRIYKPVITFEMMQRISQNAFQSDSQSNAVMSDWITRDEMITIANTIISVSHSDLYTIFQQWFYREESELPFSKEFFAYWYNESGKLFSKIDGKIASLIAIEYHKKFPNEVHLPDVIKRFVNLCRDQPDSHGAFRYLSLCFYIAGDNEDQKVLIVDAWVKSIIDMLYQGKSVFHGAQFSTEFFIEESCISTEAKKAGLEKIQKAAEDVAVSYKELVQKAQKAIMSI